MLVYRAINLEDINNLENKEDIKCSLVRTNILKSRENHEIYFKLCIEGKRQYALDVIAGHIAGARLRVGMSPWISTTKDFSFACSEYAIPQAGAYNEAGIRKPVIIIETDEVLSTISEVKILRENDKKEDIVIDLSNGNLNNLYGKAFMSEAYNENMPGYDQVKDFNHELNSNLNNINGLSNYALYAKEVLFFKQIRNKNIKCIIYPILQDILYGCNVDMEKSYKFLEKNIDDIYSFLNHLKENNEANFLDFLYLDYKTGNNLTDYLYDNYNNINGNNIYEKYDYLKEIKKEVLKYIILKFNQQFKCKLELSKLIDDEILVLDLNNPIRITNKQINDLIIVKEDKNLYRYNSNKKKYISNKKEINKNYIKELKRIYKK